MILNGGICGIMPARQRHSVLPVVSALESMPGPGIPSEHGARHPAGARHRAPAVPPAHLRVGAGVVAGGFLAGGCAVIGLWAAQVAASSPGALLHLADGAHLAGLLAGYGVLGTLLLMARVPVIEHGIGADRLARWHARAGRYVLSLIVLHAVLAVWAHATRTATGAVPAVGAVLGRPGLLAATAGTLLLVAVGVVSARAVRRRVRHETWRTVHLLVYAGAALAFVHQLPSHDLAAGPHLAGVPVAAWLWGFLHMQIAILLVYYRCVVPLRQAVRHSLRVAEVRVEGPGVVSVYVTGERLEALRAEPGQFFRWRFLTSRLWRTALPFSLSAPVRDGALRITVRAVGGHTRRVRRLRPGVRVIATGPFGAMTAHRRTRHKVLLLAGGIGITPLRALFESLPGGPGDITLLYRASTAEALVLRAELEEIAGRRQARLHYLLGAHGSGDPLTSARLRELVPDIARHDVFLCGSPGMATASVRALRRAGVPARRIHAEVFTV
jgi:ferredoxin-NADP reductase